MADDKIIPFPTDKIKYPNKLINNAPADSKLSEKIRLDQTKRFVESAVDDISMGLLKNFVDLWVNFRNNLFAH